jgi:hypothetical protein
MKLSENQKNIIITDYIAGKSTLALSKNYGVSQWSIKKILDKNDIKTRTLADLKIKFDENFFFANTPETYYFWGFMLGDGSLIQHKQGHRYISISIEKCDEAILHNFCRWLSIDIAHIKHGTNNCGTEYSRLEVYGTFFKQDFSKFGLVPNKTYYPSKLEIPKEYIQPFLLGLIDADGNVAFDTNRKNGKYISKEYNLSVVGHSYNMNWCIDQIRSLGFNGNINEKTEDTWKRIRVQRKEDIIDLSKLLEVKKYYPICLERKWNTLYFYNMSDGSSI